MVALTVTCEREKPMRLDTLNNFGITAHQGRVVAAFGPLRGLSIPPVDALRLAAWLILAAELAGYGSNTPEAECPPLELKAGPAVWDTIDTVAALRAT